VDNAAAVLASLHPDL